ncbi:MAG: hydrogenase maturation peptidase HycI [Candidatus Aenigmatarchaeota archaeon]|nr:MAG: hydrogenase maturation peptidase HycI [Candidatus Aenigmarchaeota archaeon]
MNILLGIGNEIKGDDGVGNAIAREFSAPGWKSIPCETVPENFTAVVKREKPELLVMVDATDMGLEPGEMRLISKDRLNTESHGTHSLPLRHFVTHLGNHAKRIIFMGIQPKNLDIAEGLSPEVTKAKERVLGMLKKADFSGVKHL